MSPHFCSHQVRNLPRVVLARPPARPIAPHAPPILVPRTPASQAHHTREEARIGRPHSRTSTPCSCARVGTSSMTGSPLPSRLVCSRRARERGFHCCPRVCSTPQDVHSAKRLRACERRESARVRAIIPPFTQRVPLPPSPLCLREGPCSLPCPLLLLTRSLSRSFSSAFFFLLLALFASPAWPASASFPFPSQRALLTRRWVI
jgi:hypothetical protein